MSPLQPLAPSQSQINSKVEESKSKFYIWVWAILWLGLCVFAVSANAKGINDAEAVPGEYLVKTNEASLLAFKNKLKATWNVQKVPHLEHVYKLRAQGAPPNLKRISEIRKKQIEQIYSLIPEAQVVEPNFIYRAQVMPSHHEEPKSTLGWSSNDPEMSKLWGMERIKINELWKMGVQGSRKIKVAVIDTGISLNHPDLKDNIWTNPNEIPDNGIDDDGDGFIDDVHGWNFASQSNNANDDQMHGSHCSGTIGAVGNNGVGVAGVNWNVSLVPVKFLDAYGSGTLEGAVQAVRYATKMGVQVMSNSWGGGGYSQLLLEAIQEARNAGILFVAAAGNDSANNDEVASYPANYEVDNIISVAAINSSGALADFSNYGKNKVHVAAPGVNIFSTVLEGGYRLLDGTSMATPHVSGLAALLWSVNPKMNYAQIKERILQTVTPNRALRRKVISGGEINAEQAFSNTRVPVNEPNESEWLTKEYSIESPHPYENSKVYSYEVKIPHAKYMRIIFDQIETESKYDPIYISGSDGQAIERISGSYQNYVSDFIEDSVVQIKLVTDSSINQKGFSIKKVQYILK